MDHLRALTSEGNTLWPRIFLAGSFVVLAMTFASVLVNFATAPQSPGLVVLNLFCLVFSVFAVSLELRQFALCRRIVYYWVRYAYVLVDYMPRGLFYIFHGTLLLGSTPLMLATGVVSMVMGVVVAIVSVVVRLPTWQDAAEQRQAEDDMERYYGIAPSSATAVAARAAAAAAIGSNATTSAVASPAPSPAAPYSAASRNDFSSLPPSTTNAAASGGPESAYANYMRTINEDKQDERSQRG